MGTLENIGLIYRDTGSHDKARTFLYRSLAVLETLVGQVDVSESIRTQFRAQFGEYYRAAIAASFRLDLRDEAFHTLERYRAQSLLNLLVKQRLATGQIPTELHEIAARSDAIYHELDYLKSSAIPDTTRIQEREAELKELRRRHDVIYAKMLGDDAEIPKPLSVEQARKALDPGTLLLSFSVGQAKTHLFVLSHEGGLDVHELEILLEKLQTQLELYRALLVPLAEDAEMTEAEAVDARAQMGQWLYNKLLSPAEKRIAKSDRLLILPDGPLHYLPFPALTRAVDGLYGTDATAIDTAADELRVLRGR